MRRFTEAAALGLVLASGCAGNSLDGSLAEAFDLTFSSIQIRRSPTALAITYLRSHGQETVISLTVSLDQVDVTRGGDIDLSKEYAPGHPRAAVSRAVDDEPVRRLPTVVRGTLSLDGDPAPGRSASGSFNLAFGDDGDLGTGRTLTGRFAAPVEGTSY